MFAGLTTAFTVAGLTLITREQNDRRAVSLGAFFMLVGSAFADPLLSSAPSAAAAGSVIFSALASVQVAAFQPYYFWEFVRDFPRRIGPYAGRDVARTCAIAALACGIVMFSGNLALFFLPAESRLRPFVSLIDRSTLGSFYWPSLILLGLPILPYIAWKARRAPVEERRRAQLLLAGVYLGITPAMLVPLVEFMSPRALAFDLTPLGQSVTGALVYPALLSIPLTTAYAIIVHHALDVRLIVRKALRYAIAKSSLIFASLIPFALVSDVVYARRHQTLVEVTTGRPGLVLIVLTAGGFLASMFRRRLLTGLDRRFFREQYNAHEILNKLMREIKPARPRVEIAAKVSAAVDSALHLESVSLLVMDATAAVLAAPAQSIRPLSRHARIVTDFLSRDQLLDVDWTRDDSWVRTIPDAEMEWLIEADARLVIAVRSSKDMLLGALVLGGKRSELPFSKEDRSLLGDIAKAVGEAIEAPPLGTAGSESGSEAHTPAAECPLCGVLDVPDERFCRDCNTLLEPSVVPCLLAGKYEPVQRVGKGGMGVVYKSFDRSLSREVALKTLPRAAPFGAARMRREARAMAAVSHPNLEAIYAAESWRGTPILIVEFLDGGTLAERLRRSPLDVDEALALGQRMGAALVCLHRAGILHRDIKPANIGFKTDGTPKLLDFGLAWMLEAGAVSPPLGERISEVEAYTDLSTHALTVTGQIVGTLPYLSPESVNGAPPTALVDLWALSIVLYESLAGFHPLTEGNAQGMLKRILCDDIVDVRTHAPFVPEELAKFLQDALSRDVSRRPASAQSWQNQIERLRTPVSL